MNSCVDSTFPARSPRNTLLSPAAALLLLIGGCSLPRYERAEPLNQPHLQIFYLTQLRERYPQACRLTQRILVTIRSREFDMTGYLYLRQDGSWTAVCLGEMGMEIFRFQCDDGGCKVAVKPASMPPKPLRDGIIGDIRHLFAHHGESDSYLVTRPDGTVALVLEYEGARLDEYQFSQSADHPVRSLGVVDGRIVREATYCDPILFPGCLSPLSRKIVLRNHRWHYTMEIILLDVRLLE